MEAQRGWIVGWIVINMPNTYAKSEIIGGETIQPHFEVGSLWFPEPCRTVRPATIQPIQPHYSRITHNIFIGKVGNDWIGWIVSEKSGATNRLRLAFDTIQPQRTRLDRLHASNVSEPTNGCIQ